MLNADADLDQAARYQGTLLAEVVQAQGLDGMALSSIINYEAHEGSNGN